MFLIKSNTKNFSLDLKTLKKYTILEKIYILIKLIKQSIKLYHDKSKSDADLESGGGADFHSKKIRKFCRPFFRSSNLIFRALPKY